MEMIKYTIVNKQDGRIAELYEGFTGWKKTINTIKIYAELWEIQKIEKISYEEYLSQQS